MYMYRPPPPTPLKERTGYRQGPARFLMTDGDPVLLTLWTGGRMEQELNMLKAVNAEIAESKKIMQQLHDEVRAIGDIVGPQLLKQIEALRAARMAAVTEVQKSLSALRDVRNFFLESTYEVEITRLERLVRLCREVQALKQAGVFDAICESALNLAVKEPGP